MSNRREIARNWAEKHSASGFGIDTRRPAILPEAKIGLNAIINLTSSIPTLEEILNNSLKDPKSEKPLAENIKPDSPRNAISRVGKINLSLLRRRRGRCGCSSTSEKPCQRRSCPARMNVSFFKKKAA